MVLCLWERRTLTDVGGTVARRATDHDWHWWNLGLGERWTVTYVGGIMSRRATDHDWRWSRAATERDRPGVVSGARKQQLSSIINIVVAAAEGSRCIISREAKRHKTIDITASDRINWLQGATLTVCLRLAPATQQTRESNPGMDFSIP